MKKVCTKCGKEKDTSEFLKYKGKCRSCRTEAHNKYIKEHPQKRKEYSTKYCIKHKKQISEKSVLYNLLPEIKIRREKYNKQYRKDASEKIKIHKHKYYEKNKKYIISKSLEWYKKTMKKDPLHIKEIQKRSSKKQTEKQVRILNSSYISSILRIPIKNLRQYPELIEAKREHILLRRELNKVNHT